jgi:heptosyltransferase-2
VLLVKLAATGDVLRTTALLPAIHAKYPQAELTWLTAPAATGLFAGNRLVDAVWSAGDAVTAARLARQQFDVVLCPDADPEAAALAAGAEASERHGFTTDRAGRVVPLGPGAESWFRMGVDDRRKRANAETYQRRICAVLDLDPARIAEPILEPSAADHSAARELRGRLPAARLIGMNTGAGGRWPYKQWYPEHQRRFLSLATARGHAVLLLGGPEEARHQAELAAGARGTAVFDAGTNHSYGRFAALVELCDVVVTGDTFALHVATARRRPVVALFGPTSSAEIELYGRGEKLTPPGFDCLCCYLPRCDKVPYCQQGILPETVLASVERWLR